MSNINVDEFCLDIEPVHRHSTTLSVTAKDRDGDACVELSKRDEELRVWLNAGEREALIAFLIDQR